MAHQYVKWRITVVKMGFIVEGATEKIIIESDKFKAFLNQNQYELVHPVIDAKGGGNLLPEHIEPFIETLENANADIIVVLTDLEDEKSVEAVRKRITHSKIKMIFVAVKAIEAWFLADTKAMKSFLRADNFMEEFPERTEKMPRERIQELAMQYTNRGIGNSKPMFAKKMVEHYDFSIEHSAQHPNCPSAKEFISYFETSQNSCIN